MFMGAYCQKQDKMLLIKMAGGNCSDGDDLVGAVVNKPKIGLHQTWIFSSSLRREKFSLSVQ